MIRNDSNDWSNWLGIRNPSRFYWLPSFDKLISDPISKFYLEVLNKLFSDFLLSPTVQIMSCSDWSIYASQSTSTYTGRHPE